MDKEKQLEHVIRPFRQSSYIIDVGFGFLENWLEELDKDWQNNGNRGLNLSPDFQRGHVWTDQQRSRYVEYVLRGGNAQLELQWNHPHWDGVVPTDLPLEMQIIDGKQRLEAVRMFLREEITAFDRRASYFKGTSFDPKRSLFRFKMNVHNMATRKEVLQFYLDLNSGGVVHSSEEINRVREMLDTIEA